MTLIVMPVTVPNFTKLRLVRELFVGHSFRCELPHLTWFPHDVIQNCHSLPNALAELSTSTANNLAGFRNRSLGLRSWFFKWKR